MESLPGLGCHADAQRVEVGLIRPRVPARQIFGRQRKAGSVGKVPSPMPVEFKPDPARSKTSNARGTLAGDRPASVVVGETVLAPNSVPPTIKGGAWPGRRIIYFKERAG